MLQTTTHLIAARTDFRARGIVQQYGMDIIKYTWILTCLRRGFLVDLEPQYMVATNKELEEYFKVNLDKYEDHWTQPVDPNQLRDLLDKIDDI